MNGKQKILVVDEDDRIRKLLKTNLEKAGFEVDEATGGIQAIELAKALRYDLILLDIMLSDIEGLDVCARIRSKQATPIIILSAKSGEINRVEGFEAGADDYIVKPFSPRDVLLRVSSILRRITVYAHMEEHVSNDVITVANLKIPLDDRIVIVDDQEIYLTPKEYEFLLFVAKTPNKAFSRAELMQKVWKYDDYSDLRTIDTYVKRVRHKIIKVCPETAKMIKSVWGLGYKLEVPKELK